MISATLPPDEGCRLQLLAELAVLDTPAEAGFDALTQAAQLATGWPVSLVSLVDDKRQWFKSHAGLSATETPREMAFCAHALLGRELLEVADTHDDLRFADNPLVTGAPGIRAYAGLPLVVRGVALGTLCVINTVPARLDSAQRTLLRALATALEALLTERLNRTQLALERERLADFAAASGDWLWECDEQQHVVWLSSSYALTMGTDAASQLGLALPDGPLLDARGQPLQDAMSLHQLLRGSKAFNRATIALPTATGERLLSFSAVPIRDRSGQQVGMRGSARDVTQTMLSERARDAEARLLRTLVDLAPGALYQFQVDESGVCSFPFVTKSLQSMFEVSAAQAADAQPIFDRIHADDRENVQDSIEASLAELKPWQNTFRVCLPVAGERYLSAHSSPHLEPEGGVMWHGMVTDVTPQVLERRERRDLRLARDRAQRDSQARADALSHISHELRTPLNAILGFTQLMQAELRDDQAATQADGQWPQWVQQVHRAASHLLALVNDVLELSSLEARRFIVELQPVDAVEVARQVLAMSQPQALLRRQELQLLTPGSMAGTAKAAGLDRHWVLADKRALRQVLINLMGNACKYTPVGGHIVLRLSITPSQQLRLEVRDDGPGISPEQHAGLFKAYERGAQAHSQTVGTGLGLNISQQLVRAMRGELTLESEIGKGSVFAFNLPLAPQPDLPVAQPLPPESLFGAFAEQLTEAPSAKPDARPDPLPDALLLYVEDEPVNGLLMQEFVARTPRLRLRLAVDVAQGLAAVKERKPDLLLLDMHLPDGSGYDLLSAIRAEPATANLRVVALSADAMPEQMQKALAAGFDDYWTKPIDFQLLLRRLRACLPP